MPAHVQQRSGEPARGTTLETLNRAILDTALDCIITMDASGHVREFNPAAERVFGFTRDEAVGKELASLIIPPRLRELHRRGLAHYLQTGEGPVIGRRIEIDAIRQDGSEILVELAITSSQIDGAPLFTAYLRDITQRVRDDRRRAAQYKIASLIAGSGTIGETSANILETITSSGDWVYAAIWLYDESIGALRCHHSWHRGEEKLQEFAEHSQSIQFASGEGLPGRVWQSKKPTWISDVTTDTNFPRAGVAKHVGLRGGFAFPLHTEGTVNGIVEMFSRGLVQPDKDLLQLVEALGSQIGLFIERRRIEDALRSEKENAEAANAAKDRFLAMLSHELRTPLTPVLIWATEAAKQPDLDADIAQGLKMVSRNIELEARLIDDMLDLTRITRGKLKLEQGRADLHELVQHALQMVGNELEDRKVIVRSDFDAIDHEVFVDGPRLQQVFWNIFRNAYKFSPEGDVISVHSSNPSPHTVRVEISDKGIGIEPQFLERIFDAFEQIDSRREGLGLGLAISKAIIELHGGTIQARSGGLGQGATFIIELPVVRSGS